MKKSLLLFFVLITYLNFVNGQNFKDEAIEAKDTSYQCFIQLTDSTIIKYAHLKYKMPPLSYGYLQGDGEKLKYQAEDILCFQDEKGYWLRIINPSASIKPVVGRLSLDNFFAVRIAKGKIEMFMQYANNGRSVSDDRYSSGASYYIKKGSVFTGVDIWGVNLKNMMSDNKKMYSSIDVNDRKKIKELIEIVEEYNKSK
jgi:hypothetical protein